MATNNLTASQNTDIAKLTATTSNSAQALKTANPAIAETMLHSDIVTLVAGQSTTVNMQAGHFYKIRSLSKFGHGGELQIPDNVIATHKGDSLFLRYGDGSTVNFENFYTVCRDALTCNVNVVADASRGITLTSDMAAGGVTTSDGGQMVYAHGNHDVLMAMARGQTVMEKTFSTMGDAPMLTYLPQTYSAPLGLLSEMDGVAILGTVAGALVMGGGLAGGGGGGGGASASSVDPMQSALASISNAADNKNAGSSTTSVTTFRDAGVTGVTSDNVGAINSALNSAKLNGNAVNSTAKIQDVVNAYNNILAEANGAAPDATPHVNPSASTYASIGADIGAAANTPVNLQLLDDIVGGQTAAGVRTIQGIDNLARIANAIELTAAGGTPSTPLTAADFGLIGLTGINATNLPVLLGVIAAQSDDGAATDTVDKLQALVDTTPPAAPAIASIATAAGPHVVNAMEAHTGFDISGAGEAGATVHLSFSSGTMLAGGNDALVSSNGTWTVHVSAADVSAFGQGSESASATQTDTWGNASISASKDFSVDTTAPVAPHLALATDSGSSASDGITSSAAVNVTALEVGAAWQYQIDGGAWINGAGSSFNLSDGAHSYAVHQTDAAGNVSSSAPVNYTLDTTVATPHMALATDSGSSASDGVSNVAAVNLSDLEAGAHWQYSVDPGNGGTWTDGTGNSFNLSNGTHGYAVRQVDAAGNASGTSSSTFTLDITPPSAPTMALASDSGSNPTDGVTNVKAVNLGNLESNASWQYQLDGGAWHNGTGSSFNLSEGQHSYAAHQTDLAGNSSGTSVNFNYTLDTAAPTVDISAVKDASTLGLFHLTFTFNETVLNFVAADIKGSADAVSLFTATSGSRYTADVFFNAYDPNNTNLVSVNNSAFEDIAGNLNMLASQKIL